MEHGDLSAPTCNDCHGNHGAVPPEVGSVANACGQCHGRIAELFAGTRMKHAFEEVNLPGCASCHGYHDIQPPTDAMLGMGSGAVCNKCHEGGQHGATFAGAELATRMRTNLDTLKARIFEAAEVVEHAERLGMEVGESRFGLQAARSALTEARTLVHSFAADPLEASIQRGLTVADAVQVQAERALEEHTSRRVWLAASLLLIGAMVAVLLVFLRRFPPPATDHPV
jgi:predicted CXXCH cytochrome family protein